MLHPAAPSDLPAVAELVNAAYRGGDAAQSWTHEADYIDGLRTWPEALAQDLVASPDAVLLVLRDEPDAEVQGCVWLEPAGGDAWYLGLLSVRPELQDRKLGRRLLKDAEAWAAARGARRMRLTVVNVRDTLIAWYQRQGYALTGETQPFPYHDQRFGRPRREDLEFVVLEKPLRTGA
jgi:GNAT superfamily N-acetyltransferase